MDKKYDVIRVTVSSVPFAQATDGKASSWTIAKNLSHEDAKKEFEEQEHLSKLFADGTYHVIQEAKEVAVTQ